MRLPFLQVDGDFLAHRARDVAALLGVSRAQAVGHMSLLWAWALSRGTEDAPPSGLVMGLHAVRLIESAAEWTGAPGAFFEALADSDVNLVEKTADGVRIRGLDRYAVAWERQRKERVRKAEWTRSRRAVDAEVTVHGRGDDAEKAGKTQTQTQTHIEATASQEPTSSAPVADDIPQAAKEDVHEADERPALVLAPPAEKPEALQAAWNQHAHPGLPRWQGMSEKRRRSAAARLRERPLAEWVKVIQRLSASPFCRGEEKGSSWRASPDWLLQPDVADKVLEGKYDRQAAPERHLGIAPPPGAPTAEDRARAHREYLARQAAKKAAGGET